MFSIGEIYSISRNNGRSRMTIDPRDCFFCRLFFQHEGSSTHCLTHPESGELGTQPPTQQRFRYSISVAGLSTAPACVRQPARTNTDTAVCSANQPTVITPHTPYHTVVNPHLSAVPSDFTGTIAGERHY